MYKNGLHRSFKGASTPRSYLSQTAAKNDTAPRWLQDLITKCLPVGLCCSSPLPNITG